MKNNHNVFGENVTPEIIKTEVPEIYCDGLMSIQMANGVMKLGFFSDTAQVDGQFERRVIIRLCLPAMVLPFINSSLLEAARNNGMPETIEKIPEIVRKP